MTRGPSNWAVATAASRPASSAAPRVAVVEDDADTRANLQDILELDGFEVESLTSAADVRRRTDWANVTAIILDRRLPDGDALALIPHVKAVAPDAAIVMVTGHADVDGAVAALRLGTADYILKPINPEALRGSLRRIAQQRETELQLEESWAQLERERDFVDRVIETVPSAVVLLDACGRIIRFNRWLEEASGWMLPDVLGRDWFDTFVPPAEHSEIRRVFSKVLTREDIVEHTNPITARDGRRIEIRWFSRVLRGPDGALIGVLASGQDVTELRRAQEKAVQVERLAAVGEAMTGLIHESRNALQRCHACTEMLAIEVADQPEALDLVERIQRAASDLHRLFEEVREYAAPIQLHRVTCDLCELWRSVRDDLAISHSEKAIGFRESCPADGCECRVDPFRVRQVLRNVLENAIQASPKGGEIDATLRRSEINGRNAICIQICDQGPGIPREHRQQVLDPFFTTKAKGTGLGMAICKRIVDAHGGRLTVGDAPGGGARIDITLPLETA